MKIRDRVYTICFLTSIVPMTFMGLFINSIISNELKKEEQYKIEYTLHNVNEYLGKLMIDVSNSVDNIAHVVVSHKDHHMPEDIIEYLKIYGGMREEVEGYYFADSTGRFFSSWPRTEEEKLNQISNNYIREGYDPRIRPWYKSAKETEKLIIGTPYKDAFDDNIVMTASKKVDNEREFLGVIGVDFNFHPINLELYKLNPWKKGGFLIVSSEGELLIDASTIGDFYNNNRSIIKRGIPGEHRSPHNEDILYNIIPLDYFNFNLVGVYSEKEIYNTLYNIRKTIFFTMILSLLFSIVIVATFGRKLSSSMDRLSYLINSIAKGNYTKNIDKLSTIIDDRSELFLVKEAVKNMQSQIKNRERQLKNIAEIDHLTKTLNRKTILDVIDMEIQKKSSFSTEFSIIMFDYDRFKSLNDNYGHLFGDKVLIKVSEHIKSSLKEEDFIGRYGGEEFVVVLLGTGLEDAVKVGERIRKNVEEMVWETGVTITISGGIVEGTSEKTVEELIKKADDLLYEAKDSGRNCIKY